MQLDIYIADTVKYFLDNSLKVKNYDEGYLVDILTDIEDLVQPGKSTSCSKLF